MRSPVLEPTWWLSETPYPGCKDMDGDGVSDLIVGAPADSPRSGSELGAEHVDSGREAAPIMILNPGTVSGAR